MPHNTILQRGINALQFPAEFKIMVSCLAPDKDGGARNSEPAVGACGIRHSTAKFGQSTGRSQ